MTAFFPESARLTGAIRIGEGGSGLIYAASHATLGEVAVKVAVDQSPAVKRLLSTEYALLRSFDYPGIIKLYDLGLTTDHRIYLVMELLKGGSLYDYTDTLALDQRFLRIGRVISALEYLHNLGIIHRDLKGENILLDKNNQVRLTDLGLATGSGDLCACRSGTVEYMAPEVIDNQGASTAADIYSLGVVLYRVTIGELPFVSHDPLQVISLKREPDRLDFESIKRMVSSRFSEVVRKCLDPEPLNRFKSVTEIAEQLILDGLLSRDEMAAQPLSRYFHHHIWSYSTSFVRQEIHRYDRNYRVNDHLQGSVIKLLEVISDHLKMHDCIVETAEPGAIAYRHEMGGRFEIKLGSLVMDAANNELYIDYLELDRFAFDAILSKLFCNGIDNEVADLLYRFTAGNLHLLQVLLLQLESEGHVDLRVRRINLTRFQLYYFSPSDEYYEIVRRMLPEIPSELRGAVALLAVDRFESPRAELVRRGLIEPGSLDRLAGIGLLDAESSRFSRSYFREYLLHQIDQQDAKRWHEEWIKLIEDDGAMDQSLRDERLFYHFVSAGKDEEAIEAALRLASQLSREQKSDQAIGFLQLARALPGANRSSLFVSLMLGSAELAKDSGDLNQALAHYAKVIRAASRGGDRESLARGYKNLGDVYKGKCDYRRGHHALDRAVQLYGELGNELELSHCFNNIGNIYWIHGDLDKAEINYETALEVQRRLNERRDVASTLSNLGTVKCVQQKLEEGIELYRESIQIKRELKDYPELARTANNIAVAYCWIDELKIGREYLEESLEINLAIGAEKELLYNYENFVENEQRRGDFDKVDEWIYKGLRQARRDDYSHRGIFTIALADLMMLRGRYGKAGSLLAAAVKNDQAVTDKMLTMKVSGMRAEYYRLQFDCESACGCLDIALELADKMGEARSKAIFLIVKARLERMIGSPRKSVDGLFNGADEILMKLPVKREKLQLLLERTDYYLSVGALEDATAVFETAQRFPQFEGYKALESQLCYLGGLLNYHHDDLEKAITLLNDAVLSARVMKARETTWRALVALGDAFQRVKEYEKALRSYIEAFSILKELSGEIVDPVLKKRYLSDRDKLNVAKKLEELSELAT